MTEYIYGTDEQGGHWLTDTEIVRCRDCAHFTTGEELYDTCDLWADTKCRTLPDGFCAWGERKVVD